MGSGRSDGRSRSWFSVGEPRGVGSEPNSYDAPLEAWQERTGPGLGEGLGRALGEGLANGLGNEIGERFSEGDGSVAFWRGVAACALLVTAVVLVLLLAS